MTIITPGTTAPEFSLQREDGGRFTNADLAGKTVVLVFYPNAFSPVCTDQFQVYEEALGEITRTAPRSTASHATTPHRRRRSASSSASRSRCSPTSSPRARLARALGAYFAPAGFTNRALVVFRDGVVAWSWLRRAPGRPARRQPRLRRSRGGAGRLRLAARAAGTIASRGSRRSLDVAGARQPAAASSPSGPKPTA